ncbi:class I SAM-dependent methyltransferase [filamentous cyanobacterium LEGE 11480]|uniref:Class I SAM-dependent methyltransferase n=1 Tax=Romeriopsis navalis LEGE 11480 TaxID=2777977 RepID=A0A928Z2W5_9CYAN|nr:class I SAM-dependent methyltransferase [Romeriopsis navalis]MBE9028760.1 class I SAM-dependent methyltransferase [Romeriopsis navalis LEGE 11480]
MSKLPQDQWQPNIQPIIDRFNKEYERQEFDVPDEVQAMPIFQDWVSGALQSKSNSPFWELVKPQKKQRCLDIGCGFSFLIYPWREWDAVFYGQEVSLVAQAALKARGPQLNSKLFKGVEVGPAHALKYEQDQFDLVIATGFSCYYPLEYWSLVLSEVKRVLKPGGVFVMDVLDPETEMAENWAILETYLGAEVNLEDLSTWKDCVKAAGGKVVKQLDRELFQMWKVTFS